MRANVVTSRKKKTESTTPRGQGRLTGFTGLGSRVVTQQRLVRTAPPSVTDDGDVPVVATPASAVVQVHGVPIFILSSLRSKMDQIYVSRDPRRKKLTEVCMDKFSLCFLLGNHTISTQISKQQDLCTNFSYHL